MVVKDFETKEIIELSKERITFLNRIEKEVDLDKLDLLRKLIIEKIKGRNVVISSNLGAEIGDGLHFLAQIYDKELSSMAFGVILFDVLAKDKAYWKLERISGEDGKMYVREK